MMTSEVNSCFWPRNVVLVCMIKEDTRLNENHLTISGFGLECGKKSKKKSSIPRSTPQASEPITSPLAENDSIVNKGVG